MASSGRELPVLHRGGVPRWTLHLRKRVVARGPSSSYTSGAVNRAITYFLLFAVSAVAAPEAHAAFRVTFVDGGTLSADAVAHEGGLTIISLEGGGTMGVLSSRISSIEPAAAPPRPELPILPAAPPFPSARASGQAPEPAGTSGLEEGEDLLMGAGETGGFAALIRRAAARHGVDAELLRCVLLVESAFDPRAVSPKGAMGLAQLMPGTARDLGVQDPFDAEESVDAAARLLGRLLEENEGRFVPALAAYNAGPGSVRRYGGLPPYGETIRYVERVLSLYYTSPGQ